MYSGTTIRVRSGRIGGAHQIIDRAAHRHLRKAVGTPFRTHFPGIEQILHFEGKHGPDGIKRKSPGIDEPWHFINPDKPHEGTLLGDIDDHYHNLVSSLRENNQVRAAFEAAWLSHVIVDGLTPAHHIPLREELIGMGRDPDDRNSTAKKMFLPGATYSEMIRRNWRMWGSKGLMSSHILFELGVAAAITKSRVARAALDDIHTEHLQNHLGYYEYFMTSLQDIAVMDLYDQFLKTGWTPALVLTVRRQLVPIIVTAVMIAWYSAYRDAA